MSLALYNCRNVIYTNCRRFNVSAFSKNNTRCFTKFKAFQSKSVSPSQTSSIRRSLSHQPNPDTDNKPAYNPLMEFPEAIWPRFFQVFRCWLTCRLILPSVVKDFNLVDFMEGSQQAVYVVSSALSREDYESLDGLVKPEAIEVLKKNVAKMSDEQKRELQLEKKEFIFSFPWEINVRHGTEESSKIVEIVMVYHLLRNWKDPQAASKLMEANSGMQRLDIMHGMLSSADYFSHAIICNYRFIREFGSADTSWYIDIVNQFKLSDVQ